MDQREAERAAEERYRQLVESAPAGILQVDGDGVIVEANAEACRLFGYEPTEMTGAPVELLVPEDLRDEHVRQRSSTDGPHPHRRIGARARLTGRRRDGSAFPVEIGLSSRDTDDGWRATAVILDVTELSSLASLGIAAAKEYHERFDVTAAATSDALWDWKIPENEAWWNQRFYDLSGYDPATQPSYDAWLAKVHPDDRERASREFVAAMEGDRDSWSSEYRFQRADGTSVPVLDRGYILRDDAGAPVRMTGSMVDVSAIKDVEAALEHQAQTYRTLLSNLQGVVYRCRNDADWTMTYMSGQCFVLTGYHPEDLVDRDLAFGDLVHPDDRDWLWESCQASIAAGTRCSNEYRIRTQAGEEKWVWDQAEAVRDEDGSVVAIKGLITDITDRRQAESDRAGAEERYRALVEHIPAITYIEVTDPDAPFGYRDVYVSPQIESILGYSPEEWLDGEASWANAVHPDDFDRLVAVADRATETGEPYEVEFRMLHRDGHIVWIHDEAFELRGEGQEPYWHGIMYDITQEREAREARIATETAQLASQAKSEFLSRVSHELRTPLNAILGFAQLMRMDELSKRHAESVDQILAAGQHLLGLVDEILDIARIEAGGMTLDIHPTLAMEAVSEMVSLVRPLADVRRVTIKVHGTDPGLEVAADARRLRQILLNLLSNAVKYDRDGGTVTVVIAGRGDQVRVDVADTGPGLSEEDLQRAFDPFDRLDAPATGVEGTGLGLSVSRALAESMLGSLTAESMPGTGSTFTLLLPAPEPDARPGTVGPGAGDGEDPERLPP